MKSLNMLRYNYFILKMMVSVYLCFLNGTLTAQIRVEEEPKMLYYEWTHVRVKKFKDMRDFRDVFHKDRYLMGKKRIMGNISYNTGGVLVNDGNRVNEETRQAVGFYTRLRFFEEFSFNTTFFKDFNPKATARWTSDFNYSIGRYNWRPNTFNYGYENFINNKYSDNLTTLLEKFLEGYYFLSYHYFPEKAIKKIKLDHSTNVKLTYFARYSIRYRDENEITYGGLFTGKLSAGGSLRYTIVRNLYVESAVYFYIGLGKKQPWDPDYSYGFGYFDWRSFRISVTYGNWVINRFPWNETQYPRYNFLDGNFRIVANWMW